MRKSLSQPKLEIQRVFQADAAEILAARYRSQIIHGTSDISASGAEIEEAVRRLLRRKLPDSFYVGHGHIIDSEWRCSPQLDVIIADRNIAGAVFRAENGAEYFMYESVYAIGGVKASYLKAKKPFNEFVDTLSTIKGNLVRDRTPRGYVSSHLHLTAGEDISLEFGDPRPYKNPLFSFMVFASGNNFKLDDIEKLLMDTPDALLPNAALLLDEGVVLNADATISDHDGDERVTHLDTTIWPDFTEHLKRTSAWGYIQFGNDDIRAGGNFAALYSMLVTACNTCVLMPPDMMQYYGRIFQQNTADIFPKPAPS